MIGLMSYWQELYGTIVYFLSFIMNGRYRFNCVRSVLAQVWMHRGRGCLEVSLFVGLTNGLWFFLPLLGIFVSYKFVSSNSFDCVRI